MSTPFERLMTAADHRDARDHLFEALANDEITGEQAQEVAHAIADAEEEG